MPLGHSAWLRQAHEHGSDRTRRLGAIRHGGFGYAQSVELYQAEWCPYSHRVRQRLTELRLDFLALQVPAEPEQRDAMRRAVGEDSIPVLVDRDEVLHGDEAILAYLDRAYSDAPDADRHRAQARAQVPHFDEVAARHGLGSSQPEPAPAG